MSGSAMFSAAVSIGSRLKNWKMKPMWSRRSFVSAVSSSATTSTPADHVRSSPAGGADLLLVEGVYFVRARAREAL